jgi:hypothetical protein
VQDSWYDTAQICLNGHVITASSIADPEYKMKFCEKCGAQTIDSCQNCRTPIRGDYHVRHVIAPSYYSAPSFCHNCGKPYPWTDSKIRAAQELSDELDKLTDKEKDILKKSLDDIIRDTPQTQIASVRFKKLVTKAGPEAATALKQILVDIASEAAKKAIWGS